MSACGSARWLWLLVLAQLAIPSRYYVWSDDPEDERFAWRMFSSVRFRKCEVKVSDLLPDGRERPVALKRLVHASWIGSMRRGRKRVIQRFLAQRCAPGTLQAAVLRRSCEEVDGQPLPRQRFRYDCSRGSLDLVVTEPPR